MTLNYDPSWTLGQAIEADEDEVRRLGEERRFAHDSPGSRWLANHMVSRLEKAFEDGDSFALMMALSECARAELPLPDWVALGYLKAFRRITSAQASSWDDVFGRPYPKGTHMNSLRKKRIGKIQVWTRAREIQMREPDTPIDEAFFERVGKEFNFGKTLTAEYYYAAKALFSVRLPPKSEK